MKKSAWALCLLIFVFAFGLNQSNGQVNVTTWHNDNWRTGQNTGETHLKKASFNSNGFGLLCKIPLKTIPQQEQVYAQPLVVANSDLSMTVYVATMQDNVYVFNVPSTVQWTPQTCAALQQTAAIPLLRGPLQGQFPADVCFIGNGPVYDNCSDTRQPSAICPSAGVLGTPVIDNSSNTMYLITASQDTDTGKQGEKCKNKPPPNNWYHYMHALDLTSPSLAEKNSGPVLIPQVTQGYGQAKLVSQKLIQRPGLLFLTGAHPALPIDPTVYAAFSMMDGSKPNPSGWVLAYEGANLGLGGFPRLFATVQNFDDRNRFGGGIWQGGAGLAAGFDGNNNQYIYLSTGDGQFDVSKSNYGDSFLKLSADLQLSDYFTPADWDYRWTHGCHEPEGQDKDLGSAGEMLVPDGLLNDPYKHIVIKGDKEPNIWVIDRAHPGGTGTGCAPCQSSCGTDNVRQKFAIAGTDARTTPAFWYDGTIPFMYVAQQYSQLQQYKLNCGPICTPASATTSVDPTGTKIGYATTPSVSSYGYLNGLVWAIDLGVNALFAFDAENLAKLYSSNDCKNNRDIIGKPTRFSVPTIANGYVFVGTETDIDIFGTTTAACN